MRAVAAKHGALAATLLGLGACHRDPPPDPPPDRARAEARTAEAPSPGPVATDVPDAVPPSAPRVLPDVATEWCLEGWKGLDESTCYLVPEPSVGAEPPDELLVYLAGIVPPGGRSASKEHVQRVVGNVARREGVAAILPRGRLGIGPKDAKDWWAWPTSPADYVKYAATLVAEWKAERTVLEAALGRPFKRVYLGGSSSGAYFLTMLAFAGAVDFDGYIAASGGAVGSGLSDRATKRPFYVGWGEGDPTSGGPRALAAFLKTQSWPTAAAPHPTGHGAREVYLDEALAFFRGSAR